MQKSERYTLGVIIGTENNASMLDKCLSHLWFVDEIIVTDLSNNDEIKNMLARKYPNAKHFFDTDRNLKNRHLYYQNILESDYMLLVSYDEYISEELAKEIILNLEIPCLYNGLSFRSIECSYGDKIKGEKYYTTRVIKKGFLRYYKNNIHEEPVVQGEVGKLNGYYEHHSNPYFMVVAVKNFRYELVNAATMSVEQLQAKDITKLSAKRQRLRLYRLLLKSFYRVYKNRHFLETHGFTGYCSLLSIIVRTVAEDISPTNELQFRLKKVDKSDTHGFFNI